MTTRRSRTSSRSLPATAPRSWSVGSFVAAVFALLGPLGSVGSVAWLGGCGGDAPPPVAATPPLDAKARETAIEAIRTRLLERNLAEASAVAEALVARSPEDPAANAWSARVLVALAAEPSTREEERRSLLADASRRLEVAIAGGVDDPETLAVAASCDEAMGEFDRATERWTLLVVQHPEDSTAVARQGLATARAGRLDEARALLEDAIRRFDEDALVLAALGEVRLEQGDESGLVLIAEARHLDPSATALRLREAVWQRRLGRPAEAVTLLAALPEAERTSPAVTRELAASWRALGEPRKVAEVCEVSARASPRSIEPWLLAAEAWLDAGEPGRAMEAIEIARSIDPSNAELARLGERLRPG